MFVAAKTYETLTHALPLTVSSWLFMKYYQLFIMSFGISLFPSQLGRVEPAQPSKVTSLVLARKNAGTISAVPMTSSAVATAVDTHVNLRRERAPQRDHRPVRVNHLFTSPQPLPPFAFACPTSQNPLPFPLPDFIFLVSLFVTGSLRIQVDMIKEKCKLRKR